MEAYFNMTIVQLKEEAKARGIKGVSTMKKQELAELLVKEDQKAAQKQKAVQEQKAEKKNAEKKSAEKTEPVAVDKSAGETPRQEGQQERRPVRQNTGVQERPSGRVQNQRTGLRQEHVSVRPQSRNTGTGQERLSGRPQMQGVSTGQERSSGRPQVQGVSTGQERSSGRPQAQGMSTGQERLTGRPQSRTTGMGQERTSGRMVQQPSGEGAASSYETSYQPRFEPEKVTPSDIQSLDSGETRSGILEIMPENFGFIRCDNYLPGENDVYVSPSQIRRFGLRTGDIICGNTKIRMQGEKFSALLYIKNVNGVPVDELVKRKRFEELTPIFPNERIHLETPGCSLSMRMVDLISPIGKGQRGMIVSQPKAGKTTLLKQIAKAITTNHPDMNMIILLIDERPEEVTDIKESIEGKTVEVIYSTFDELPENHKRVSEMVIERAKRLVEQKRDVVILLDSITRLARAYNLTIPASGRTLSGGLDPAALHMPKKFFGAARNMREGGSLTILATALVETGSRMDDVVFEEFKGTGNMELQLDRNLSERRVFPAIDLPRSSTRRDDLLLTKEEQEATSVIRKMFSNSKSEESMENIMRTFQNTKNNAEFIEMIKKYR